GESRAPGAGEIGGERPPRGGARRLRKGESTHDRGCNEVRIADRRKLHDKGRRVIAREFEHEPRLSSTAGPGDRDQALLLQPAPQLCELAAPADEPAPVGGSIRTVNRQRLQRLVLAQDRPLAAAERRPRLATLFLAQA